MLPFPGSYRLVLSLRFWIDLDRSRLGCTFLRLFALVLSRLLLVLLIFDLFALAELSYYLCGAILFWFLMSNVELNFAIIVKKLSHDFFSTN